MGKYKIRGLGAVNYSKQESFYSFGFVDKNVTFPGFIGFSGEIIKSDRSKVINTKFMNEISVFYILKAILKTLPGFSSLKLLGKTILSKTSQFKHTLVVCSLNSHFPPPASKSCNELSLPVNTGAIFLTATHLDFTCSLHLQQSQLLSSRQPLCLLAVSKTRKHSVCFHLITLFIYFYGNNKKSVFSI